MCQTKTDWERCVDFHGHSCPGLAIGYRAAKAVMDRLNTRFAPDEEVVCVAENDTCAVDAVQVLSGCTIGKGNLLSRNTGKMAFSFFCRKTGKKARIVFKKTMSKEGMDRAAFQKLVMEAPVEEIFDFKEPSYDIPENARMFSSLVCEKCGESAAEYKMRLQGGKTLCLDCFQDYSRGW